MAEYLAMAEDITDTVEERHAVPNPTFLNILLYAAYPTTTIFGSTMGGNNQSMHPKTNLVPNEQQLLALDLFLDHIDCIGSESVIPWSPIRPMQSLPYGRNHIPNRQP
jgi:lysophospholipase L1-like esterase